MMTGERISGAEAPPWGIVNHVVPASELDKAVDSLCETLAFMEKRAPKWKVR
jgi:enoyl-CoA hydratase/carnithine racemase